MHEHLNVQDEFQTFFSFSSLAFIQGVPHLLAEDSHTELDNIDYDDVYNGEINKTIADFKKTANQVAPLFDRSYQTVLEIGAGTGRFSLGFAENVKFDKYIITDVSIKMLLQLEHKLLQRLKTKNISEEKMRKIKFLGLDCERFSGKSHVLDLVTASGVVHHILEYEQLLYRLFVSLKKTGQLYLMEPNLAYHSFMVYVLGLVMRSKRITDKYASAAEFSKLQSWRVANFNLIKYQKEKDYLRNLEDKYLFKKNDFYSLLKKVGYKNIEFIPRYPEDQFSCRLGLYLNELQLPLEFKNDILQEIKYFDFDFERLLKKETLNPSYHIIAGQKPFLLKSRKVNGESGANSKFGTWKEYKLKIYIDSYIPGKSITGWAVAIKTIQQIKLIENTGEAIRLLLTIPRPDVNQALARDGYPDDVTLHSGFDQNISLHLNLSLSNAIFEFCDGESVEVGFNQI